MAAETREKVEYLVSLKVMRLKRPSLCSPIVVTSELNDLPGHHFNSALKNDITAVAGSETLSSGQFLLTPQSFSNIYLGETFSCYICVHNDSNQIVKDVSVKADLQTRSQRIQLYGYQPDSVVSEFQPQQIIDNVIHHDVREDGTYILVCEVSYLGPTRNKTSFRKFYKFQVLKPIDIKTKFYNAESDEVYLEAQIQNTTSGPICLEKVSLESSHLFNVTCLNKSVFSSVNVLQPQAIRQFLYCLSPQPSLSSDLCLLSGATNVGKLDIVWRSNLGERGQLQTSQLQRIAPDYGDLRLSIQELPNIVHLEEPFNITCRLFNTCDRIMDLILGFEQSVGLVWCGISGRKIGQLEPGASKNVSLSLVPLTGGLQNISGVRLMDVSYKKSYKYDDIAQVFVTQKTIS